MFFMINSAEYDFFSANKYRNTNNSCHFHIYLQRKVHAQLWDWNALPAFIISSAESSQDPVARFASLVRSRD